MIKTGNAFTSSLYAVAALITLASNLAVAQDVGSRVGQPIDAVDSRVQSVEGLGATHSAAPAVSPSASTWGPKLNSPASAKPISNGAGNRQSQNQLDQFGNKPQRGLRSNSNSSGTDATNKGKSHLRIAAPRPGASASSHPQGQAKDSPFASPFAGHTHVLVSRSKKRPKPAKGHMGVGTENGLTSGSSRNADIYGGARGDAK
jgi:hypothetical protein